MRTMGLLLVLLAAALFGLLRPPAVTVAGPTPAPESPDLWTAPPEQAPHSGARAEIAKRPLFEPRRRPPAPEQPEEPAPEPPRIRLSAVTVSSDLRIAVIEELDSGRTRRVREGEDVDQWTIKRVYPDRIVLQWRSGGATDETARETTIPLSSGE